MASNTPKSMSSRLMTMKFMQRGAAKAASQPSTPTGPPSSKRVRLSNGGHTPGTPSDHEMIQAALAAEERIRQEAVDKASAKAGETKWVLSFQDSKNGARSEGLDVVQAGFAVIDADDDSDEDEEQRPARMQFGGGLPKEKPPPIDNEDDVSDEESGEASDSDDYDSDDPTADLIRETKRDAAAKERDARKARKRETREPNTRTPTRAHEDMNLGGLSSLSGSGQRRGGLSGSGLSNMECFKCKQKGHKSMDCPNRSAGPPRGSSGRGRGRGGRR